MNSKKNRKTPGEWGELYHGQVVSEGLVSNVSKRWRCRHGQLTRHTVRHLSLYWRPPDWSRLAVSAENVFLGYQSVTFRDNKKCVF